MRKVAFTPIGWDEYVYWQENDRKLLRRINLLIEDIRRHGNEGIGKPERLHGDLAGSWSRRINQEHRLVYLLEDERLTVVQCRFHYSDG